MDNNNDDNRTLTEEELNNLSEDQLMDVYCEGLLAEKGVELSGEERDAARSELKERLGLEINRSILAALPDEKFAEIEAVTSDDGVDMDVAERVIKESGIDVNKITEETMGKFRELFLQGGEKEAEE